MTSQRYGLLAGPWRSSTTSENLHFILEWILHIFIIEIFQVKFYQRAYSNARTVMKFVNEGVWLGVAAVGRDCFSWSAMLESGIRAFPIFKAHFHNRRKNARLTCESLRNRICTYTVKLTIMLVFRTHEVVSNFPLVLEDVAYHFTSVCGAASSLV